MPEAEIGRLNFLEFDLLLKRKQLADDRLRLNAGYVWAAVHNTAMGDPDRRAMQPSDIVPRAPGVEEEPTYMTPAETKNYLFKMFQGDSKPSMR